MNKTEKIQDIADKLAEIDRQLDAGEIKIDLAQARVRALDKETKAYALAFEHAVKSGRVNKGDDTLPPLYVRPKEQRK